jgi:hypothetical protein
MVTSSMSRWARGMRLAAAVAVVAVLAACAHPISLESSRLPERDDKQVSQKKVAYVITEQDRAKEVTSGGGGGDMVRYFPYRDMEAAIRAALRSVYTDVVALKSAGDAAAVRDAGVAYVFVPEIATSSSSPSMLTWPPTHFTAHVICTVTDAQGGVVAKFQSTGSGAAEWSEFKSDFSLSARRAVSDVAQKLAQDIRANEKLR